MGLTEGGDKGRRGLLDMNNHKRPSRQPPPVGLTSVKTSPSFRADTFRLQQRDGIQWKHDETRCKTLTDYAVQEIDSIEIDLSINV